MATTTLSHNTAGAQAREEGEEMEGNGKVTTRFGDTNLNATVLLTVLWSSLTMLTHVQGRTPAGLGGGQYRSGYGQQHASGTNTGSDTGKRGWGNGGGVMRGQGGGGYGEGGGGGRVEGGGRMTIRDLVPHQPNTVRLFCIHQFVLHKSMYIHVGDHWDCNN